MANPVSLVHNYDFEFSPPFTAAQTADNWIDGTAAGSATNLKYGWWPSPRATAIAVQFDATVSHSGTQSLKVSTTNTTGRARVFSAPAASGGISASVSPQHIPVVPGGTYVLSGWVKVNNSLGASIQMNEVDNTGTVATTTDSGGVVGTAGFTFKTCSVTVAATTVWMVLGLTNATAGNVSDAWFDDLILSGPGLGPGMVTGRQFRPPNTPLPVWNSLRTPWDYTITASPVVNASVAQVAATVTAAGGTQVSVTNATVAQVAGVVTASGGTQALATSNFVAIAQLAATVTATGGVQVAATNASAAQVAATVTASGGSQSAVTNAAVTQTAAIVTASGGTQAIATVNNVSVTQLAATVTATGGTQAAATSNFVAVAQVAGVVTASGGTQVAVAASNATVTQLAATVTASGGTQVTATNASVAQVAATVTAAGGAQATATSNFVAVAQLAGVVTAAGGTQTVAAIQDASVAQSAASITAMGGTALAVTDVFLSQLAAIVTAVGGVQDVSTTIGPLNASVDQVAATVTAAGGLQIISISTSPLPPLRTIYIDTDANVYLVIDQLAGLLEPIA